MSHEVNFEALAGAWEIYNTGMTINNTVALESQFLYTSRFKFATTTQTTGGNLTISTLDGSQSGPLNTTFMNEQGYRVSDMVALGDGSYSFTDKSNVYRQNLTYQDGSTGYYELQAYAADYKTSPPWEYLYFSNVITAPNNGNNYVVQTVLHKIPDDTVEDSSLVAGTWRIVSASYQISGDREVTTIASDFNRTVELLPQSGYLFWTQDINGTRTAYNSTPFNIKFDLGKDALGYNVDTTVALINPMYGVYNMITPNAFETPRVDNKGNHISFQQFQGSGLLPWDKITFTRYNYENGVLLYKLTAVLERVQ